MRSRSVVLVVASAVAGVVCGVGAGLAVRSEGVHGPDPLGLGIPFQNQPCNRQVVLAVAAGNSSSVLGPGAAADPGNVRYLDTRQSCRTTWSEKKTGVRYVAYTGPYSSTAVACGKRMSTIHRGDTVIRLTQGVTTTVQCLCYLSFESFPVLRPGQDISVQQSIYVNALQNLLVAMQRRPDVGTTSGYDTVTQAEIAKFQQDRGLPANSVVTQPTWHSLQKQGCARYGS